MEKFVFREADLSDIELLVELRIQFMNDFWGNQPAQDEQNLAAHLAVYFTKHLALGDYITFLAFHNGEAVGVGAMHIREMPGGYRNLTGRVGYLMNMYTMPAYRRMGICNRIAKLLLEKGKLMGLHMFELHATEDGQKVYPKLGFNLHKEPTYRLFTEISDKNSQE